MVIKAVEAMLAHCDIYSRLFVLICAAVMSFIMHSHAARANPLITSQYGEKNEILRRLNTPHSQHHPLLADLVSTDAGTEANIRDTLSVTNHQSRPVQYIKGSFSYSQNNRDNTWPRVRITKLQRGGVQPASSSFPRHSLHGEQNLERWQSRSNDNSVHQKEHPGTSYSSHSLVIRKSHNGGEVTTSDSSKVHKSFGKLLYPPHFPSQTSRHLMPGGHFTDQRETNEHPLVRIHSASNKIEPSKVLSFSRRTEPHAATLVNSWDATVIKRNPTQEQLTPYYTNDAKKLNSVDSGETPRPKMFQSYLFKGSGSRLEASPDGQAASRQGHSNAGTFARRQILYDVQEYGKPVSHFKPFSRIDPIKPDSLAHSVGQKQSFTKHQTLHPTFHTSTQSPSQTSSHPPSLEKKHFESSVRSPVYLWDTYAIRSGKVAEPGRVNATRDLTHKYKPGGATKGIFHLKLIKPPLQPAEQPGPSSTKTTNSQQSSLHNEMENRFKIANAYPSKSHKYSFGQREASVPATAPAKPEKMNNSPSSPGALNVTAVSTPGPFTTAFKRIQHLLSETDASMGRNTTPSRFRLYKGMFGLEGFGSQPQEGARPLADGPNMTVLYKPGFEGFKRKRWQTWQPKRIRIHRWYNQTGGGMRGNRSTSTESSDGLKPLPETKRNDGSTSYKKHSRVYPSQRLRSAVNGTNAQNGTRSRFINHNPGMASQVVSSGYMKSAGRGKAASGLNSRQRTAKNPKLFPEGGILRISSTSSTVRGKRVKLKPKSKKLSGSSSLTNATGNAAIVRLPRVSPVTYADILGSASFSSVKAASQTPTTLNDGSYFPNMTAAQQEGGKIFKAEDGRNTGGSPGAASDSEEKDFSVEEADNDVQTSDLFLDQERSGVRGFNLTGVLSTVAGSQRAGKESLELDYLRISNGNISFKSAKQSDLDQQ